MTEKSQTFFPFFSLLIVILFTSVSRSDTRVALISLLWLFWPVWSLQFRNLPAPVHPAGCEKIDNLVFVMCFFHFFFVIGLEKVVVSTRIKRLQPCQRFSGSNDETEQMSQVNSIRLNLAFMIQTINN